ncbi:hypothetical protein C0992_008909 [Termitomyces sp. T32_za158]|nr:hypothetical protein C0992_008909 [Termitomyces sp. T32_za158]
MNHSENFIYREHYDPGQGLYPVFRTDPDERFINNIIDNFLQGRNARELPPTSIVSYTGTTQYQFGGNREASKIVGAPSYERFLDGVRICAEDAVPGVPYFSEVLDPKPPLDGLLRSHQAYREVLEAMDRIRGISASIITSPPEILAAMKIPMEGAYNGRIFVIFDSHGNSEFYSSGSGIIICPTIEDAAKVLMRKYHRDVSLGSEICASFVVPKLPSISARSRDEVSLAASIRILDLENQVSELNAAMRKKNPEHDSELEIARETVERCKNENATLLLSLVEGRDEIDDLKNQLGNVASQIVLEQQAAEEIRTAARHDVLTLQNRLEKKDQFISALQSEVQVLNRLSHRHRKAYDTWEEEMAASRHSLRGESIMDMQREPHDLRHNENWTARMANQAYEGNKPRTPPTYAGRPGYTRHHTRRPTATASNFSQRGVRESVEWEPGWVHDMYEPATSSRRHDLGNNHPYRHR